MGLCARSDFCNRRGKGSPSLMEVSPSEGNCMVVEALR